MRRSNYTEDTLRAAREGLKRGYNHFCAWDQDIINAMHQDLWGGRGVRTLPCRWMLFPVTGWQFFWNTPEFWPRGLFNGRRYPGLLAANHVEHFCPDELGLVHSIFAFEQDDKVQYVRDMALLQGQQNRQPGATVYAPDGSPCACGERAALLHVPSTMKLCHGCTASSTTTPRPLRGPLGKAPTSSSARTDQGSELGGGFWGGESAADLAATDAAMLSFAADRGLTMEVGNCSTLPTTSNAYSRVEFRGWDRPPSFTVAARRPMAAAVRLQAVVQAQARKVSALCVHVVAIAASSTAMKHVEEIGEPPTNQTMGFLKQTEADRQQKAEQGRVAMRTSLDKRDEAINTLTTSRSTSQGAAQHAETRCNNLNRSCSIERGPVPRGRAGTQDVHNAATIRRTSHTWTQLKVKLLRAGPRIWSHATGPTGAAIAMLLEAGRDPTETNCWQRRQTGPRSEITVHCVVIEKSSGTFTFMTDQNSFLLGTGAFFCKHCGSSFRRSTAEIDGDKVSAPVAEADAEVHQAQAEIHVGSTPVAAAPPTISIRERVQSRIQPEQIFTVGDFLGTGNVLDGYDLEAKDREELEQRKQGAAQEIQTAITSTFKGASEKAQAAMEGQCQHMARPEGKKRETSEGAAYWILSFDVSSNGSEYP
ncbi:unnamed protein product [Prorocentrum cordatum]|uniref:Uncharacterized protein n=1 Tax=Prorocentrum cordatum TaxID=2364126 RepID=A0ABN9VS50_9DINO|nr:unnamed protein product [Polarella glacialis]